MKIVPNEEFVKDNYDRTIDTFKEIATEKDHPLFLLLDGMGERYALCPATSRKEYYSSFPGGLAYHNLHMFFWMKKFTEIIAPKQFSDGQLFEISILHEIGKLGDLEHEYYLPKNSDWHMKNGIFYEVNPKIQFMRIPDRSLYLAQEYYSSGRKCLTPSSYLSILLHEGREEGYQYKLPKLATITQFAYKYSTQLEKANEVCWP
jgi:hypothetical protein